MAVVGAYAQPSLQLTHQPAALLLMEPQTLLRREIPLLGHGFVFVYPLQGLQHEAAFVWEVLRHLDELAPAVGIAVGHDCVEPLGVVA